MRGKVCTIVDRRWNQVGDFMQFSSRGDLFQITRGGGRGNCFMAWKRVVEVSSTVHVLASGQAGFNSRKMTTNLGSGPVNTL